MESRTLLSIRQATALFKFAIVDRFGCFVDVLLHFTQSWADLFNLFLAEHVDRDELKFHIRFVSLLPIFVNPKFGDRLLIAASA